MRLRRTRKIVVATRAAMTAATSRNMRIIGMGPIPPMWLIPG